VTGQLTDPQWLKKSRAGRPQAARILDEVGRHDVALLAAVEPAPAVALAITDVLSPLEGQRAQNDDDDDNQKLFHGLPPF